MPKYYGQDYNAKTRTGPIDKVAVHKDFQDEHAERNELLQILVDRINLVLAKVRDAKTREASYVNYTDPNGTRTNVADALDTHDENIIDLGEQIGAIETVAYDDIMLDSFLLLETGDYLLKEDNVSKLNLGAKTVIILNEDALNDLIDALGTIAYQDADSVDIDGGVIDGVAITGSTIDSTVIGGTTPAVATFQTDAANDIAITVLDSDDDVSFEMRATDQALSSVFIGRLAGNTTFTGAHNFGIGTNVGVDLTTGSVNFMFGTNCGANITTGQRNFCMGYSAGNAITTASDNILMGSQTGRIITGASNSGIGASCLYSLTSGVRNSVIGQYAGFYLTGSYNTGYGYSSISALTTGNYNTSIGYSSGPPSGAATNTTCLGANATVTGDNQVQLGDSSTTTYAYGAVQDRSDKRDKADVYDEDLGLDFLMELEPKRYKLNYREDYDIYNEVEVEPGKKIKEKVGYDKYGYDNKTKKRSREHRGFIAQDVEKAAKKFVDDFAGVQYHKVKGGKDVYTLGYAEFISPIVKAIQELKANNDALEARIEQLEIVNG